MRIVVEMFEGARAEVSDELGRWKGNGLDGEGLAVYLNYAHEYHSSPSIPRSPAEELVFNLLNDPQEIVVIISRQDEDTDTIRRESLPGVVY